jgi:carboxymethylenebutenolidase
MDEMIQLNSVSGCLAQPDGEGPWPAVIVVHEWWGLDAQTCSIASRIASLGYLAFAPDLYHGELAELGNTQKASALVQRYAPGAPAELEQVFDLLAARPGCNGKLAIVGFCFGGRMALTLGLTRPLDAVVTFYGGGMQQIFDRLVDFKPPAVLGFFGDRDVSIPAGTIDEFDKRLDQVGVEHEIFTYPNSGHAFFRDSDPSVYRPEAARDAWERLQDFFARRLG